MLKYGEKAYLVNIIYLCLKISLNTIKTINYNENKNKTMVTKNFSEYFEHIITVAHTSFHYYINRLDED